MTLPQAQGDPERWKRVGELFDKLANAPPEQRESILAASTEPVDIKEEARMLVEVHDRAEGFLDAAPLGGVPPAAPAELPAGSLVGQYKINGVAGRGGMGSCGGSGAACGGHNNALWEAAARIAAPSRSMRDSSMPKLGQVRTMVTGPSGGRGATQKDWSTLSSPPPPPSGTSTR